MPPITLTPDAEGLVTLYAVDTGVALRRHPVDARELLALDPAEFSLTPVAAQEPEVVEAPKRRGK